MKFYLSKAPANMMEDSLSVIVNNVKSRKKRPLAGYPLFDTPEEKHIRALNEMAAKPPFSGFHKTKKHEML